METKLEKPIRYGITPLGLLYLGWVVMMAVVLGLTKLPDLFRCLIHWLSPGN